jgi:hypothetical protein
MVISYIKYTQFYSVLAIFFSFKNSKDTEAFLALKNGRINSKTKALLS